MQRGEGEAVIGSKFMDHLAEQSFASHADRAFAARSPDFIRRAEGSDGAQTKVFVGHWLIVKLPPGRRAQHAALVGDVNARGRRCIC